MSVRYTERGSGSALADFLAEHAQVLSITGFFLLCVVFFSASADAFLTSTNLFNILRQAAPILVVAVAMTYVIITAGIDLSVGSQVALINALAAIILSGGWLPWPFVVFGMLSLGALIGLAQGWFVAYQGIPAFIVTLAGLSIFRGLALYLTQGYSIPINDLPSFLALGRGQVASVPVPAVIAVSIAVLGTVVLARTVYGRRVVAVGSNPEAARRAGMPARGTIASVYMLTGVASAVAGLLIAARLGSGSSNAAVGLELQVIAAVVLGGTSLFGGRGSILGTILGTMTIALIGNGLILMHISPFFTQIVTGIIILFAIWLNTRIFTANFRFDQEASARLMMTHASNKGQNAIRDIFGRSKALIGMVHCPALPGAPRYRGATRDEILSFCLRDADRLIAGGIHGLIIENHGDVPFSKPEDIGHETAAFMAVVADRISREFDTPFGVNVLANAPNPGLCDRCGLGCVVHPRKPMGKRLCRQRRLYRGACGRGAAIPFETEGGRHPGLCRQSRQARQPCDRRRPHRCRIDPRLGLLRR